MTGLNPVTLSMAISEYDHVRDFAYGRVRAEGIEIDYRRLGSQEIFKGFTESRAFDIAEMSFGRTTSLVSQNDKTVTALPVFTSRVFRHSGVYIRPGGPVKEPKDLEGKRVGIPEWTQTAGVYIKGWLQNDIGVDLASIDWYQTGVDRPDRKEPVDLQLPGGIKITPIRDRGLVQMMAAGEIDAFLSAGAPSGGELADGSIARMYPDWRAEEEVYYERTGIYPIMHIVALKGEVVEKYPWAPMNLFKAFSEAKARSLKRVLEPSMTQYPIPWGAENAARARDRFGPDFWPYGLEPNRTTIEAFVKFAYQQGIAHRLIAAEELFPPQVLSFHSI